jgi:TolA-binding protein
MNDDHTDIETIDQYLGGELNVTDRKAFEKRLSSDEGLRAQLAHVKLAIEGIQANGVRERIQLLHDTYVADKRTRTLRYISGIAASLVVLAVASYFLIFQNQGENFYSYFTPYPPPINVRGEGGNYHQAIEHYQREDFGKAAEAFAQLGNNSSEEVKFYLGVSLLGNKRPREASVIFEQLSSNSSQYEEPVRWYLALCYLESREYAKGKHLLMKIEKDDYQFDAAQQLLSGLK